MSAARVHFVEVLTGVVHLPFLGVGEHCVGFADLFELFLLFTLFVFGGVGETVRVVHQSAFLVRFLDIFVVAVFSDA